MTDSLIRFSISVDKKLSEQFDELIKKKGYSCRSEAVRDLMRDYIVDNDWEDETGEVVGTVTMVYDHKMRELSDKIVSTQHSNHSLTISSMHVHLDADNCLEVLAVKGRASEIRRMADRLLSMKGVKHGKLVMSSTGRGI